MDMKQKKRAEDEKKAGTPFASPLQQKETKKEDAKTTERSVFCTHGIHSGNFPVGGMTVAAARESLSGLLNISPEAICVIGGVGVDEDHTIGDNVKMITFVKQASVKGFSATILTISGKSVAGDGFGMEITTASDAIAEASVTGMDKEPLPSGCVWKVKAGLGTVYIIQLEPALRRISVKEEDQTSYTDYRLATPYVILKVPLLCGAVVQKCELFYRNQPVRSADDPVFWSNLLNVSPNSYGVYAWVCTQFLTKVLKEQYRMVDRGKYKEIDQLDALVKHVFDGGFNRSSEHNEGQSCFGKACKELKDKRVTDWEAWQQASVEDPSFILGVDWKPVGVTIRELIEKSLRQMGCGTQVTESNELASLLLGYAARNGIKVPAGSAEKV